MEERTFIEVYIKLAMKRSKWKIPKKKPTLLLGNLS